MIGVCPVLLICGLHGTSLFFVTVMKRDFFSVYKTGEEDVFKLHHEDAQMCFQETLRH